MGSRCPVRPRLPPDGAQLPGVGRPQAPNDPKLTEADPTPLLAQVEGYARDLALALRPPTPNQRPRPHRSRGELVLERALEGHERPFAYRERSRAVTGSWRC